jgi:thioesterase domain-containing protein
VALLALIDSRAPAVNGAPGEIDENTLVTSFARHLGGLSGGQLHDLPEELRRIPAEEQLKYILRQVKTADILSPDVGLEQMRRLFRVFSVNSEAVAGYRPGPYQGGVSLFRAAENASDGSRDLTRGWRELASGGVAVHDVPGTHYSIIREPGVRMLAERLAACLDEAARRQAV